MAIRSKRQTDLGLSFTRDAAQNIAGWFFAVPLVFRDALDIKFTERKVKDKKSGLSQTVQIWTKGSPPRLSFDTGDIFYDAQGTRQGAWKDVQQQLRHAVTVLSATADRLGDHGVIPGEVEFELLNFDNGHVIDSQTQKTTQEGFADFLKTGNFDDKIALATPAQKQLFNE